MQSERRLASSGPETLPEVEFSRASLMDLQLEPNSANNFPEFECKNGCQLARTHKRNQGIPEPRQQGVLSGCCGGGDLRIGEENRHC